MLGQPTRFERWRGRDDTKVFVSLVETEVVPRFLARGYEQPADYPRRANWLPLQRRIGPEWPTVELQFSNRGRPFLKLDFATLPEVCRTLALDGTSFQDIPRAKACVVDAPAFFSLCKGRARRDDCTFGDPNIFFRPVRLRRKLEKEVATLKSLCEWLINLLDQGIPAQWLERSNGGRVHEHVIMSNVSRIFRDRPRIS
jgi:hypothetical protein